MKNLVSIFEQVTIALTLVEKGKWTNWKGTNPITQTVKLCQELRPLLLPKATRIHTRLQPTLSQTTIHPPKRIKTVFLPRVTQQNLREHKLLPWKLFRQARPRKKAKTIFKFKSEEDYITRPKCYYNLRRLSKTSNTKEDHSSGTQ